ncbi:ABC transporter permease [Nocardioides jejuensis]|uniref:ABC transporter permease n=1 Tax=Nocardioides jejuensis TaxID=2502782 RepID=A0A4R1CFS7_9ACTN|nr:ABC transporter permease [Nocardioides jejuensis]TCJ30040.1 ABC transporter permease [Nocardioides jejuensis]
MSNVFVQAADWLTDSAHWQGPDGVPARLSEHVGYSALTVAIAAAIALPLGLWIGHTGRLRGVAIALTGALRALPTLGLLTLVVLWMGIGLTPPILALVVLAVPPLLAGAYAGVESVDQRTVDSARGLGFTEWQVLMRVEVPLALPLILGGVRSAVLQVVSTATVAAYIGLGGLGRYLIDGIAVRDYPQTLAGSLVVVVLALALDGAFAVAQRSAARS